MDTVGFLVLYQFCPMGIGWSFDHPATVCRFRCFLVGAGRSITRTLIWWARIHWQNIQFSLRFRQFFSLDLLDKTSRPRLVWSESVTPDVVKELLQNTHWAAQCITAVSDYRTHMRWMAPQQLPVRDRGTSFGQVAQHSSFHGMRASSAITSRTSMSSKQDVHPFPNLWRWNRTFSRVSFLIRRRQWWVIHDQTIKKFAPVVSS